MTRSTFVLPGLLVSTLVLFTLSAPVNAAVFCVADATNLQAALTTASSNGEDDQIQIVQGTYVGNFVYASTQANDLAVQGGWTAGCASREIDATNTVLDGNQTGTVLALSAPNVAAQFAVEGLTLRNGFRTSGSGGGLYAAVGPSGRVTVTDNHVLGNTSAFPATSTTSSGGGLYISGTATLSNNRIQNNTASSASYSFSSGGGVYVSGSATLTNNQIQNNATTSSYYSSGGG